MIPRIFEGESVAIVAGGPSLRGLDLQEMLRGHNVIAINRAHENLPEADVLWWTDARYWRRARTSLVAHRAPYKATCDKEYARGELPEGVEQYHYSGTEGFDENPRNLRHGLNSAYAATHLAVHLGARRIALLGVDLSHDGTPEGRNYHSGYDDVPPAEPETFARWKAAFATLKPILDAKRIAVINGSPNSRLTIWPRCYPEDALSRLDPARQAG